MRRKKYYARKTLLWCTSAVLSFSIMTTKLITSKHSRGSRMSRVTQSNMTKKCVQNVVLLPNYSRVAVHLNVFLY